MFEVVDGGPETTVQDYPGRVGYYKIGIPPSGAFDNLALRLGNLLVSNPPSEAGLEITLLGPKLKFLKDTIIAITGGDAQPKLNDQPVDWWQTIQVKTGDLLSFGFCRSGCRSYLTVAGGIDVPVVFGSKATYRYGYLGGIDGRPLKKGDRVNTGNTTIPLADLAGRRVRPEITPKYEEEFDVQVILGPQDDYFDKESLNLFATGKHSWKVSPAHVDRRGMRLLGPLLKYKPPDQRPSSDPSAHPSNVTLTGYPIGTINVCGDVPIILGMDAVSLGGFVCIATVISADLWKIGQTRPGTSIRFNAISTEEARNARIQLEGLIVEENILK